MTQTLESEVGTSYKTRPRNFVISHADRIFTRANKAMRNRSNTKDVFNTKNMNLVDCVIDAGSDDDLVKAEQYIEQKALEYGNTPNEAYNLGLMIQEGVENSLKHNARFQPGHKIYVHVRFTEFYDEACVVCGAEPPNILDIDKAFKNARRYNKLVQDLKDEKIPRSEAMNILRGRSGKGFDMMIGRANRVTFEYRDDKVYLTLVHIKNPERYMS